MESTTACSTTTCGKLRQSQRGRCRPYALGSVQAMRSMATRCSGGKTPGPPAARGIKDRFHPPLLVALPQVPEARALHACPVHDLDDPFASIQCQQGARPPGHSLEDLPLTCDLLQLPTVRCLQGVSKRVPPSHLLLLPAAAA